VTVPSRRLAFLIQPFVDGQLVAFAEKGFGPLPGEVAVASTDIDNERIQTAGDARQGLAETRINRWRTSVRRRHDGVLVRLQT